MKLETKNEFSYIIVLSLLLALLIVLGVSGTARVVLGLPFVLFSPGYTLIAALFPARDDLDGIERVALSFGLSIAVVPLLGLVLNYTPWGIRLYPILLALMVFTVIMSLTAIFRRNKLPAEKRFMISLNIETAKWSELSRLDKVLSVALVGAIIFAVGSLYYVVTTPKTGEKFTEFYILGPGGMAEDYPREMETGVEKQVIMGIVNHEYRRVVYTAELKARGGVLKKLGPYELNHEEKVEKPVFFSIDEPGENLKVEFLLYKDGENEPYRSLHLWVKVQ